MSALCGFLGSSHSRWLGGRCIGALADSSKGQTEVEEVFLLRSVSDQQTGKLKARLCCYFAAVNNQVHCRPLCNQRVSQPSAQLSMFESIKVQYGVKAGLYSSGQRNVCSRVQSFRLQVDRNSHRAIKSWMNTDISYHDLQVSVSYTYLHKNGSRTGCQPKKNV